MPRQRRLWTLVQRNGDFGRRRVRRPPIPFRCGASGPAGVVGPAAPAVPVNQFAACGVYLPDSSASDPVTGPPALPMEAPWDR